MSDELPCDIEYDWNRTRADALAAPAGHKDDKGKVRASLIPPEQIEGLAKVFTMGAAKYTDHQWLRGMPYSRMLDAHYRHMMAWQAGEDNDAESRLNHLLHAAWCILGLYTFQVRGIGKDDRIGLS